MRNCLCDASSLCIACTLQFSLLACLCLLDSCFQKPCKLRATSSGGSRLLRLYIDAALHRLDISTLLRLWAHLLVAHFYLHLKFPSCLSRKLGVIVPCRPMAIFIVLSGICHCHCFSSPLCTCAAQCFAPFCFLMRALYFVKYNALTARSSCVDLIPALVLLKRVKKTFSSLRELYSKTILELFQKKNFLSFRIYSSSRNCYCINQCNTKEKNILHSLIILQNFP